MKPKVSLLKKPAFLLSVFAALTATLGAQALPTSPHLNLIQRGAQLLAFPAIQDELALTSVQKTKVDAVFDWLSTRVTNLMQQAKPNEEEVKNTDRMASNQVLHLLTPTQTQKLAKLALQKAGYSALVEPEIASQLKLTSEQVTKIRKVLEDAQAPLIQLEEFVADQTSKEPKRQAEIEKSYDPERERLRKQMRTEEAKALNVLTPAQKKTWLDSIS